MADKIYLGSGKEKVFNDGGSVISVHLTLNDIADHFKNYGYTATNGDKRIKLNIGSRREIGTYGETHTVVLDTWKPDSAGNNDPFGEQSGQGGNNSMETNNSPQVEIHDGGNNNDLDNIPF